MQEVTSRRRLPSVEGRTGPSPRDVLFQRGVKVAGVSAQDDEAGSSSSARMARSCRSEAFDRCQGSAVAVVLRRLCARVGIGPASAWRPLAPSPEHVELRQGAYRQAGEVPRTSTIPLVLRALSRRAAAAKVLRGRRRLEPKSRDVASVASRVQPAPSADVKSRQAALWRQEPGAPVESSVPEFGSRAVSRSKSSARVVH